MITFIKALSSYVPLFQTLVWVLLIAICLLLFRKQLGLLLGVIQHRIEGGSPLKAGPIELGADLRSLDRIEQNTKDELKRTEANGRTADQWQEIRHNIYKRTREIFLAHVIRPSEGSDDNFDVFIYLVHHKSQDFSEVAYAEFFFGQHWGNRVIQKQEKERDGLIGVATSAPGPFLCVCRITFTDGEKADLYRYIDFEMSRVFEKDR